MKYERINQDFRWLSEGVPIQGRVNKIRYESFSVGHLKINVGDFVLVRNESALDPEDVLSCYVAEVKDLYDTGKQEDPNQAQVQWFSRISEIPHYALKHMKTEESEWEVIQERCSSSSLSAYSKYVDAETIFQRCEVISLAVDADWESALSEYDDHPFPVFFCRYAFTGKSLIPFIKEDKIQTLIRSKSFTSITPKNEQVNGFISQTERKRKVSTPKKGKLNEKTINMYCATPIGDPNFPRVRIKKIDDGVVKSRNGNERMLFADSSVKTIADISEKFMQKLEIVEKSNKRTKRHTVAHGVTTSPEKQISGPIKNGYISKDMLKKHKASRSTKNSASKLKETPSVSEAIQRETLSRVRNSSRKSTKLLKSSSECPSPKKKFKLNDFSLTRSGRKIKSINYSEVDSLADWIKKSSSFHSKKIPGFVCASNSEDSDSCHFSSGGESSSDAASLSDCSLLDEADRNVFKSRKSSSAQIKKDKTPSRKTFGSRSCLSSVKKRIDLSIPDRKTPLKEPQNVLEQSRQRLHVSAVPTSLPCREEEYSDIYSFVKGCLCAQTGGCMYISGVPGTGKTATVHEVMRNLEEEKESADVPLFTFIEVNGMWMTDPYQCYVQIFKSLNGKTIAPQQAADLLEKRFTERGPKKEAVVLLVDELDRLWTRKQTVMYNIFDWPTKQNSKLVVLAIANTMDLPERMMINRISSRLGLTRKTFQPYTFKQLQEIIMSRIQELKVFDPDAVQLVARKVAAVSGDARRALDICRFATEVVKMNQTPKKGKKILVGMDHVDAALQQMFSSPLISAIRSSSKVSKLFFRCLLSEFTRRGLEETTLLEVYQQVVAFCRVEGLRPPNSSEIYEICTDLATSHLILVDNFRNDLHMKIRLNVSSDDVTYALSLP